MTTESVGQLEVDAARGGLPADRGRRCRHRGLGVAGNPDGAASALPLALIHRSAWNRISRKFTCRVLYRTPPDGREDGSRGPLRCGSGDYMLWCYMNMQEDEWAPTGSLQDRVFM
jgi:hypothetical protein